MKVLLVNCVYHTGSTGKIVYDERERLSAAGNEVVVCYGRGAKTRDEGVYKTCPEWYAKANNLLSRFTGIMYGGCFFSTEKLISIIRKEQPDIVHLHCINGYFVNIYKLIAWLKEHRIKTVLTLHAEFMHTANCGHALACEKWKTGCGNCPRRKQETKSLILDGTRRSWKRMKAAFDGFDDTLLVTSVSPWLMDRAKESPILSGKRHTVVYNGVDTDIFHPYDTEALKSELGLTGKKVIFHATATFSPDREHIKGGYYILELAKKPENADTVIIVAGPYVQGIKCPDNVMLLGRVTDQEYLAKLYSLADATVLTSKKETFSMVTAESLCCGTPVIGFEAGAPEQIAIKKYSTFVPYGDTERLASAVENADRRYENAVISAEAAKMYGKQAMVDGYMACFESMCGNDE